MMSSSGVGEEREEEGTHICLRQVGILSAWGQLNSGAGWNDAKLAWEHVRMDPLLVHPALPGATPQPQPQPPLLFPWWAKLHFVLLSVSGQCLSLHLWSCTVPIPRSCLWTPWGHDQSPPHCSGALNASMTYVFFQICTCSPGQVAPSLPHSPWKCKSIPSISEHWPVPS
jgi:hypothetical protein